MGLFVEFSLFLMDRVHKKGTQMLTTTCEEPLNVLEWGRR